jgi:hypothetical protein
MEPPMKTDDLRNCAGLGRDVLEERLRECADLIDRLLVERTQQLDAKTLPRELAQRAVDHFEALPDNNRLPYAPPKLTKLDPLRLTKAQVAWAEDLLGRTCVLCGMTENLHDDTICSFGFTPRVQ